MERFRLRHLPWRQRILLTWILESIVFVLLILVLPDAAFNEGISPLPVVLAIGLANAAIHPLLVTLNIRPSLFIFGPLTLLVNGLAIWLTPYSSGIVIEGFWAAAFIVLLMAMVNVSFSDLLAIDDDDAYFHHLLQAIVKVYGVEERSERPGIVFLEIDGLAEPILRRAVDGGQMPTLGRWLTSGSHSLVGWECDLSSQTSASQAGILLGSNYDIPAFRWYEKDHKRFMVSNHPADTAEIERRLSSGNGLLAGQGASRSNLFSGDAPRTIFTFSTIADATRHSSQDFYPLLMGPYNFLRTIMLFLWEVLLEWRAARYQRRHDIRPRIHRGGIYPLVRGATTVILRELNLYVLMGDIFAGVPAIYTTFFGYDEVAHHSGIERPDAIDVLHKLDEQFDRLERTVELAPRPYHFVVLSDHGQSQGATFKQRYGKTLEDVVRELVAGGHSVESFQYKDGGWGKASVVLTDLINDIIPGHNGLISRLLRRSLREHTVTLEAESSDQVHPESGRPRQVQVALRPSRQTDQRSDFAAEADPAEVVVLASGNLGLIYFTDWDERLSFEQINETFPELIPGLAEHEGIGFLLVHSSEHGPLIVGAEGIHYLDSGRIEGDDPLSLFSPNAADHLRRTDGFPHVADIMVNSFFDPDTGEVAAFEELVGSHGGLGGTQTEAFLMYPAGWELVNEKIVGATQLHTQLKAWLEACCR
jgi:putative membrane protein